MKKRNKFHLLLIIGVVILAILILAIFITPNSITGFALLGTTNEIDNTDKINDLQERFNRVALEALYSKKYCNDGRHSPEQELREGKDCVETLYPYVKIKHGEDYYDLNKVVLAARMENFIKKEMPEISGQTLGFIFVDSNQRLIDTIYLRDGTLLSGI